LTRLGIYKESNLKNQVIDYLQILENGGYCYYERINSGELLVLNKDGTKRLVKLARDGTSDAMCVIYGRIIFIELKSYSGKQTQNQKEFQKKVESVGGIYWLINDFDNFLNKINEVLYGRNRTTI
jgi:hypothetical protein